MRKLVLFAALGGVLVLGVGSFALADGGRDKAGGKLIGYQEVPSVSTRASGTFEARIVDNARIEYTLTYKDLESAATQAHIHFGQRSVNGGISLFFCSNLTSPAPPAGTPACPATAATLRGTFTAANVVGPSAQGILAGEFAELLAAMRAGKTYANVHSTTFPGGEIRAQLSDKRGKSGKDKDDDD